MSQIDKLKQSIDMMNNTKTTTQNVKRNPFEEVIHHIQKTATTGYDVLGRLYEGVVSFGEGAYDFALAQVGEGAKVVSLWDKNAYERFRNQIEKDIAYQFTYENVTKELNKQTQNSYLAGGGAGQFIRDTTTSIGRMLPSIAVGAVSPGLGLASVGISAAGSGTESALNEGANLDQAYVYGMLSGASEMAIESAFAGIGGIGGGVLDNVAGKVVKNRIVRSSIGEGLEEVISSYLDPLLKMTYKDNYEAPTAKEVLTAFGQGALASLAINTANTVATRRKYGEVGVEVSQEVEQLKKVLESESKLEDKGKVTNPLKQSIDSNKQSIISKIETHLETLEESNTPTSQKFLDDYGAELQEVITAVKSSIPKAEANVVSEVISDKKNVSEYREIVKQMKAEYGTEYESKKSDFKANAKGTSTKQMADDYIAGKILDERTVGEFAITNKALMEELISKIEAKEPNQRTKAEKDILTSYAQVKASVSETGETPTIDSVIKPSKAEKVDLTTRAKDTKLMSQVDFTNAQAGIEDVLIKSGMKRHKAEVITNKARSARGRSDFMFSKGVVNDKGVIVKEGIAEIYSRIPTEQHAEFDDYLLHHHNIDRYKQGKPVFGEDVTDTKSRTIVAHYDIKYDDFRSEAVKIWDYSNELLLLQLDNGIISPKLYEELSELYPHYVPTYRTNSPFAMNKKGVTNRVYNQKVTGAKTAVGGESDIISIQEQFAIETSRIVKASLINELANKVHNIEEKSNGRVVTHKVEAVKDKTEDKTKRVKKANRISEHSTEANNESSFERDIEFKRDNNTLVNEISFYKVGSKVTMQVDPAIFKGFQALQGSVASSNIVARGLYKAGRIFRNVTTNYNPLFAVKNFIKDQLGATINSRYGAKVFTNVPNAMKQMKTDSKNWILYQANGGLSTGIIERTINRTTPNAFNKLLDKISAMNEFIEQATRFSAFDLALKDGMTIDEAINEASEVTVNFGRGGIITKTADKYGVPYLNAQVQGMAKPFRNLLHPGTNKELLSFLLRLFIVGFALGEINSFIYQDDEEYQALSDYNKNNFYLIKIGDQFIKIPKAHLSSAIGEAYNSGDFLKAVGALNPIPVANGGIRTIASPFQEAFTNVTWYGGKIESDYMKNITPEKRYDDSTSKLAIAIAKVTSNYGLTPKKVEYLLDQYTGVIGDVILPISSNDPKFNLLDNTFTVDPTFSNRYLNDYFRDIDKETQKANSGDMVAKARLKYLNSIRSEITELSTKLKDTSITQNERHALKTLQNELARHSISNANLIANNLKDFELSEESFDFDFREAVRVSLGSDIALKMYNKQVYEKATLANSLGIPYDHYYQFYFDTKELSTKKDIQGYIESMPISQTNKYILFILKGYKLNSTQAQSLKSKISLLNIPLTQKQHLLSLL